ncbi:NADPH-dependent FMN reductase [Bacillus sp. SL00103]
MKEWVKSIADKRTDATLRSLILRIMCLATTNQHLPSCQRIIKHQRSACMVKKVSELDGFIFVTPEYNKAVTAGLKDAIDYLYTEWNNKAAGCQLWLFSR